MIYTRVLLAMLAAVGLRLALAAAVPGQVLAADLHGIAAYLGVLGTLYSIVIAFLIYVVWEQYNRVESGIIHEAAALDDLWRVAGFLSDRGVVLSLRQVLSDYVGATANDEPRRLAAAQGSPLADERFAAMCDTVRGAPVATEKDEAIYAELLRALADAGDRRDERLSASITRIPRTIWSLVVFLSAALFAGFAALGIQSLALSLGVVAAIAGSLTFLLGVVRDIDNPFAGVWNVSYAPLNAMLARLGIK